MSVFADAWAEVSPNIDIFYGETFVFHPQIHVNGRWNADPARAVMTITAALDEVAVLSDPLGKRTAANTVAQDSSTHAIIDMAADALPYSPKTKDRLLRQADSVWFEVSGLLQDHFARTGLRVKRLGPSSS